MKKFLWMTALIAALALAFTACPTDGGGGGGTEYTVTFDKGLAKDVTITNWPGNYRAKSGSSVTRPATNPTSAEFTFDNWYTTAELTSTFNFNTAKVTADTTIYAKWTVNYLPPEEITLPPGEDETGSDGAKKVYTLSDELIAKMRTATKGSKLRMTFTVSETIWSGWGIGKIGDNSDDGESFELKAPNSMTSPFEIEMWVDWLLFALDQAGDGGKLTIVLWQGEVTGETNHGKVQDYALTKLELVQPAAPINPPSMPGVPEKPDQIPMKDYLFVREISTTSGGDIDIKMGKGNIEGEDLEAILANPDGMIRLYIHNRTGDNGGEFEGKPGWGIGTIGGVGYSGKADVDFYVDVSVAAILAQVGANPTYIFVNAYQDCAVALCELWIPDPDAAPGWDLEIFKQAETDEDFKAIINNGSHNKIGNLFTRQIWNGDVYELKMKFTSDIAISDLKFYLVDNSGTATPDAWWTKLSAEVSELNIAAATEKSITITLTATAPASASIARASSLVIANVPAAATLRVTEFTLTLKNEGEAPPEELPALGLLPPGALLLTESTGSGSQKGWQIEKGKQANAEKLVLNLSVKPAGGMQLIWQPITGGWNQADGVLTDDGNEVSGVSTWDAQKLTLTIDLTQLATLDTETNKFKYDDFIAFNTSDTKLFIGYYSDGVDDLGIRRAYLTFVGGSSDMVYELGESDGTGDDAGKTVWYTGSLGGNSELTKAVFAASKFLVLSVTSLPSNNGFGGLQLGFTGNGNSWGWKQATVTAGWTQPKLPTDDDPGTDSWHLDYNTADDFFIIVDLRTLTEWPGVLTGDQVKLYLNSIPAQITLKAAYLTDKVLTKGADGVDSSGGDGTSWAVKEFAW
jgi:hypothetical protein